MQVIEAWPEYPATAGSRYTFTYALAEGSGSPNTSNLSIVRQYLDSRPGVDVADVRKGANGRIVADVIALRSAPLMSLFGAHVNDGSSRYYSVESVVRTDTGSGLRQLTAPLFRFADWVTDPFDRFAEEAKRTGYETTKDVARFGIPTAVLVGGAALLFLAVTKR